MRHSRRGFMVAGATAGIGSLALTQIACPGGENADRQIGFVIDAFDEAMPILKDLLPGSFVLVSKALVIAKNLRQALKDKSPDALKFLQALISPTGLVNQIVDTFSLVKNDNQRRVLSGIFLIANIALRVIGTQLESVATPATRTAARSANAEAAAVIEGVAQAPTLEALLKAARF